MKFRLLGIMLALLLIPVATRAAHDPATTSHQTLLSQSAASNTGSDARSTSSRQAYYPDTLVLTTTSGTFRLTAQYDTRGWTTRQLTEYLYNSSTWVNYFLETWTFLTPTGNSVDIQQKWSNGAWVNVRLDSSTYDAGGHMMFHLERYWKGTRWQDSIRSTRTYDARGNTLTTFGQIFNGSAWFNTMQTIYTYDGSNNLLTAWSEMWVSSAWENQTLWTHEYDGHNNETLLLNQVWQNSAWVTQYRFTYTYDSLDHQLSGFDQTWSGTAWENAAITNNTYDVKGNRIKQVESVWSNNTWSNMMLDTLTYDTKGNVLTHQHEVWTSGQWTKMTLGSYAYDAHGNEISGVNKIWSGSAWIGSDLQFTVFFPADSSYYNFTGSNITIAWQLLTITDGVAAGTAGPSATALFQNYPNPFNPSTTIRYAIPQRVFVNVTVYDVLGREVAVLVNGEQESGSREVRFDASLLGSGIYFCRVKAGDFTGTRKMILLK